MPAYGSHVPRDPARFGTLALVVALFLPLIIGALPGARADFAEAVPDSLPSVRAAPASGWDGTHAYVFGGQVCQGDWCNSTREIVRYDPSTGGSQPMNARLPTAMEHSAVIWSGAHFYIFGGKNCAISFSQGGSCTHLYSVVRYDPANDTTRFMNSLPGPAPAPAAVWDGQFVYLFDADGSRDLVVRYDPSNNSFRLMNSVLPAGFSHGASAVWDGHTAHIFGASDTAGISDKIFHYSPATDTLLLGNGRFPARLSAASAIWTGQAAYIFGGWIECETSSGCAHWSDVIFRYDPDLDTVTEVAALPSARAETSAIWDGHHGYVFGRGAASSQIVRFTVEMAVPSAPQHPEARWTGFGEVTVSWEVPQNAGSEQIVGYRVFRSERGSEDFAFVGSATASPFVDPDVPLGLHVYRVTAVNAIGESEPSDVASVLVVGLPGGLTT